MFQGLPLINCINFIFKFDWSIFNNRIILVNFFSSTQVIIFKLPTSTEWIICLILLLPVPIPSYLFEKKVLPIQYSDRVNLPNVWCTISDIWCSVHYIRCAIHDSTFFRQALITHNVMFCFHMKLGITKFLLLINYALICQMYLPNILFDTNMSFYQWHMNWIKV